MPRIRHHRYTMILCMLKLQKRGLKPMQPLSHLKLQSPKPFLHHSHNTRSMFRTGLRMVPQTTVGDRNPSGTLSIVPAAEDEAEGQAVAVEEAERACPLRFIR